MQAKAVIRDASPRWRLSCAGLSALCVAACAVVQPAPQPAPTPPPAPATPPAPAPAPPVVPVSEPAVKPPQPDDPVTAADLAARRLLVYHERLRQMSSVEVASEVARLGALISSADTPATPDDVLALALALSLEHGTGDLARASSLLEPLAQDPTPDEQPWQPLAQLLAGRIAEQKRLEDQLDRITAQRRDTQRAIQQLTEKLEALKAIERSMTTRSATMPPAAGPGSAPGVDSAPPQAPKLP